MVNIMCLDDFLFDFMIVMYNGDERIYVLMMICFLFDFIDDNIVLYTGDEKKSIKMSSLNMSTFCEDTQQRFGSLQRFLATIFG